MVVMAEDPRPPHGMLDLIDTVPTVVTLVPRGGGAAPPQMYLSQARLLVEMEGEMRDGGGRQWRGEGERREWVRSAQGIWRHGAVRLSDERQLRNTPWTRKRPNVSKGSRKIKPSRSIPSLAIETAICM